MTFHKQHLKLLNILMGSVQKKVSKEDSSEEELTILSLWGKKMEDELSTKVYGQPIQLPRENNIINNLVGHTSEGIRGLGHPKNSFEELEATAVVECTVMRTAFDNAGNIGVKLGWITKLGSKEHACTDEDIMQASVVFEGWNYTVKMPPLLGCIKILKKCGWCVITK